MLPLLFGNDGLGIDGVASDPPTLGNDGLGILGVAAGSSEPGCGNCGAITDWATTISCPIPCAGAASLIGHFPKRQGDGLLRIKCYFDRFTAIEGWHQAIVGNRQLQRFFARAF